MGKINKIKVQIDDIQYETIAAASRSIGVSKEIIRRRIDDDNHPRFVRLPPIVMTHKTCTECHTETVIEKFAFSRPGLRRSKCKSCEKEKTKLRKANRPPTSKWLQNELKYHRIYRLKSRYGLSVAEYEKMASDQGFLCPLCGEKLINSRNTGVDHCHETGKVRALLCLKCNSGLGMFKDKPERLRRAADYIEMHKKLHSCS